MIPVVRRTEEREKEPMGLAADGVEVLSGRGSDTMRGRDIEGQRN
ncbi:hypothetical protein ACFWOJ_30485 [Streptomyces sp. NPDC058439]